jgi:ferredoxin-nitrite reductase
MLEEFTEEQKRYLEGFAAGSMLLANPAGAGLPTFATALGVSASLPASDTGTSSVPAGPEAIHFRAQDRITAAGGKLCPEEVAKRKRFPLDVWDEISRHAKDNVPPKGTDVLAFKYHGLFWVAPAQEAFMSRLRFPGGVVPSYQLRGVADLAERLGGAYADVTTRANLQIREIKSSDTVQLVEGLHELGIVNRGSGADNIRNVTGSPLAGIDPQELIDTRPLTRELHHYILNHREMYGLPRKFNIAYDGGGAISALEDTNDIGFTAVTVGERKSIPAGVYFRLTLGGITGHKDFARDTGVMLKADECLAAAVALVKVFIEHGDRTDRKKARLKYLLDKWGFEKFIAEAEKHLSGPMRRFALEECEPRPLPGKHGHIGIYPQKQPGMNYIGLQLPVGRILPAQMRGLAKLADEHGSGILRLTVWQNLILSDIPNEKLEVVKEAITGLGLSWSASTVSGGVIACTGAAGCKYAMAHTKTHAMEIIAYLEDRVELDQPVNIHLTGCPHSCAQHYIGDIGMLGTKVPVGDDMIEGYHVFVGGGYGASRSIGRELYRNIIAADAPPLIERMLSGYLEHRDDPAQTFRDFVMKHPAEALLAMFDNQPAAV